jgi:hypothetical protein
MEETRFDSKIFMPGTTLGEGVPALQQLFIIVENQFLCAVFLHRMFCRNCLPAIQIEAAP